jgi:alanyl-tRNA synthetase
VTERLYYTDSYLIEFEAQVLEMAENADDTIRVVLDRTAFYPTSGGQPCDTGTLAGARVSDVVAREDATIVHVVDGPMAPGPVRGRVDWVRRFDHMQQHSGQHVLSAAFERLLGVATASVHLGAEACTIDLAREVSAGDIEGVEEEANRIVWANHPVTVRFVDASEAARLPLRRDSRREGTLRLVEIEDVDLSACGGTHVDRTGAVGIIAVGAAERFRGGTRLEFSCGRRALRAHRQFRAIVSAGAKVLSVAPGEVAAGIERLTGEIKALRRAAGDLQGRLTASEAEALGAQAEDVGGIRLVVAAIDGGDANGLKQMATTIVSRPGCAAVLLSAPPPSAIVVARSADVSLDAGGLLKQITARFGGKGGGREDFAQGGGLEGPVDEMVAYARELAGRA